ncbi:lipoyl synthase [Candidatus Protochlamydia phocaeensis]|uniref:lipoyl synthase n=1 Tax=Candidatus Protochlamydia phocaeensis TaxID=1414722 RepID=UPI00083881C9|nr:lipoyl synthase [Candidatus Protochlamydia phocaeensis]
MDQQPQVFSKTRSKRLNILPAHAEEAQAEKAVGPGRFPSWLHRKLPKGSELNQTSHVLSQHRLHTVCEEAKCPNLLECWSKKTATFLVMGKECSRNCGFCDIDFTKTPKPLEADEPLRVALSVKELGLKHVVITMVARDDLADGGSAHLVRVIRAVREHNENVTVEVLTSDFEGNQSALSHLLQADLDIFNHNIETVRDLTPRVRHKATYERTLSVLRYAASQRRNGMKIKSGLMVGLGETEEQVFETLRDLKEAGCDIVTIGQYLQPNRHKLLVKAFIHPDQFKKYEAFGYELGISYLYCGPFVRSSYNANLVLSRASQNQVIINSH